MQPSTLSKLDAARGFAGVPFAILSGYRTLQHNHDVGGVEDSSHRKGHGADILTYSFEDCKKKAKALYKAGFRRFGIRKNCSSIHVDDDPAKPTPSLWGYDGHPPPFNPKDL